MRDLLVRALSSLDQSADMIRQQRWGVRADETLALAVWCALANDDPAAAVAAAAGLEHGSHAAGAITGALVGAIHGAAALPARWHTDVEGADAYPRLARRLAAAPNVTPTGDEQRADIWFLLDRSGSMASIARDVVTGFDGFFASQRATGGEATVTVVQFDDHDRHEVIVDAQPLDAVRSIAGRFEPRGSTPLYDAIGLLLDRAERRGGDAADQLVVVFTDGHENASRDWTQQRLFARIGALRDRGWTFVFLGANQDSYAAGGESASTPATPATSRRARWACRRPTAVSTARSATGAASRASSAGATRTTSGAAARKPRNRVEPQPGRGQRSTRRRSTAPSGRVVASAAGNALGAPARSPSPRSATVSPSPGWPPPSPS